MVFRGRWEVMGLLIFYFYVCVMILRFDLSKVNWWFGLVWNPGMFVNESVFLTILRSSSPTKIST